MSRKLFILFIAIFCLTLSASVWADEAEDVKQIKDLLNKEGMAVWHGEVDKVLSCYAPGFVGYWTRTERTSLFMMHGDNNFSINDPEGWVVGIANPEDLRKYASQHLSKAPRNFEDYIAKHPDWKGGTEVRHVQVKGDHAIAVTRYWGVRPDPANRETIRNEYRSVWMLSRIKSEWKITNFIGVISRGQHVTKWGPSE